MHPESTACICTLLVQVLDCCKIATVISQAQVREAEQVRKSKTWPDSVQGMPACDQSAGVLMTLLALPCGLSQTG